MKKIIFIAVAALMMLATCFACSCSNSDAPWGVEYALQSDGKTDASVTVQFFNANMSLNGDADYVFDWTNAPVIFRSESALVLADALTSNDAQTVKAAEYVNDWLDEWFKVVSFEGHYDIYIKGYVKETGTGLTFSIDRHFTNIPDKESDVDPD